MQNRNRWKIPVVPTAENGHFALSSIRNVNSHPTAINFWYNNGHHEYLFTFLPNEKYKKTTLREEKTCQMLLSELRSPNPSVQVLRFAVDGKLIFAVEKHKRDHLPTIPPIPKEPPKKKRSRSPRLQIEANKCSEPAPYILYGRHHPTDKEYCWRLTPDKPKRQGIVPGDHVLAWTRFGFKTIEVTRIEKAGSREMPDARVKKKIEIE